jgi:hypothetical protein
MAFADMIGSYPLMMVFRVKGPGTAPGALQPVTAFDAVAGDALVGPDVPVFVVGGRPVVDVGLAVVAKVLRRPGGVGRVWAGGMVQR